MYEGGMRVISLIRGPQLGLTPNTVNNDFIHIKNQSSDPILESCQWFRLKKTTVYISLVYVDLCQCIFSFTSLSRCGMKSSRCNLFQTPFQVWDGMTHVTDWLSTFLHAAGLGHRSCSFAQSFDLVVDCLHAVGLSQVPQLYCILPK